MRATAPTPTWRRAAIVAGAAAIVWAGWFAAAKLAAWRHSGNHPPAAAPAMAAASAVASPGGAASAADTSKVSANAGTLPHLQTYAQWVSGRADDWRVGRLASNPKIWMIEFPSLAAQGQALNRIAALIEKRDTPRERVLDDPALAAAIVKSGDTPDTYLFGHDYAADALARFFALAQRQRITLNAGERRLHGLLLAERLWTETARGAAPAVPLHALVTFTTVQPDRPDTLVDESVDAVRREAILRHELSHGEFFTNAAYRAHCWAFWKRLSDKERSRFRAFLNGLDYEPTHEALMVNETQAFLMHTPDERVFSAAQLGLPQATLDLLRARFRAGAPASIFTSIER